MHLMACNICVKHLQNDVVGKTHAHDLKGINGGQPYFTYFTGQLAVLVIKDKVRRFDQSIPA